MAKALKKPSQSSSAQAESNLSAAGWFIHIQGENVGPLPLETIQIMLEQNRLSFADFVWGPGLTKWVRVSEIDEFMHLLPTYPKKPIPKATGRPVLVRATPQTEQLEQEELGVQEPQQEEQPEVAPPPRLAVRARPKDASKSGESKEEKEQVVEEKKSGLVKEAPKLWPKIRYFPRVPFEAKVDIVGIGEYRAVNISEGGIFLESKKGLEVGTEVKFKISSAIFEKTLEMTGVVIRSNEPTEKDGFAIEFTRVNPAHRRLFQEYVKENLKG
ncbi:MAG: PilZ domain-containing protein [Bacteriovoracia bacterium]